jgi:hypothetical protein
MLSAEMSLTTVNICSSSCEARNYINSDHICDQAVASNYSMTLAQCPNQTSYGILRNFRRACVWRIGNCHLKTITKTVLFLNTTYPTLLCPDGPAGTLRTFINYNRQTPTSRRFESRRRRQPSHETAATGHQLFPATSAQPLGT